MSKRGEREGKGTGKGKGIRSWEGGKRCGEVGWQYNRIERQVRVWKSS